MSSRGSWIDRWEPEDERFWETTGRRIARKNLAFSIFAEHIGFSVWVLWTIVVLNLGNPQCVVLGAIPEQDRFRRLGAALEHHELFPEGTNVEFARVDAPERVTILIWERGVGPTSSSGTGSCAALVAAAAFGGAARDAEVVAPGGAQRVEWLGDSVYLTGWAEVVCEGEWLRRLPPGR